MKISSIVVLLVFALLFFLSAAQDDEPNMVETVRLEIILKKNLPYINTGNEDGYEILAHVVQICLDHLKEANLELAYEIKPRLFESNHRRQAIYYFAPVPGAAPEPISMTVVQAVGGIQSKVNPLYSSNGIASVAVTKPPGKMDGRCLNNIIDGDEPGSPDCGGSCRRCLYGGICDSNNDNNDCTWDMVCTKIRGTDLSYCFGSASSLSVLFAFLLTTSIAMLISYL